MKYLIPFVLVIAVAACKTPEIIQYKYKSTTMLGTRTITITKDSVMTLYKGRVETAYHSRATLPAEWSELQASSAEVKLNEIADLESPTNKRQSDAAPFGSLYLVTKDSTYKSGSFDGFKAHAMLLPVMATIQKISQASPTSND